MSNHIQSFWQLAAIGGYALEKTFDPWPKQDEDRSSDEEVVKLQSEQREGAPFPWGTSGTPGNSSRQ